MAGKNVILMLKNLKEKMLYDDLTIVTIVNYDFVH